MRKTLLATSVLLALITSVIAVADSACTALPSYDPATGKITIPCLNVLSYTYSVDLQQRTRDVYVFDLNLYTVKLVTDKYKIGDKGPAGGIVYYVDSTGQHGLLPSYCEIV